jgi:hypothetical protein
MTTAVQRRRGTTTEHSSFTGLEGEISVNTTKDTLVVHDGSTVGGFELARADGSNFVASTVDINGGTIDGTTIGATTPASVAATTGTFSSTVTATGTSVFASLDISGDIDVDGTTNLDVVDIDGAVDMASTLDVALDINVGGAVKGNAGTRAVSVGAAGSVNGGLQLWSTTVGTSFVQFGDEAGTAANHYRGYMSYAHANDSMALGTAGSTKVTVTSAGNVGIGTSSPVRPLSVKGSQEQLTLSEGDARGATFDYRSSTGNLNIATNGINARTNPQFTLDLNGRVGIGTSSPSTKGHFYSGTSMDQLTVDGTGAIETGINFASGGTTYGQIYFNNVSPYDMSVLQQYSTGSLIFGTNDTERMRIDSSGTLFQGTTSPTLHSSVTGIVFTNGSLLTESARGADKSLTLAQNVAIDAGNTWAYLSTDEASYYQQYGGNHYFATAASGTAGADATLATKMIILNNGNAGIGTSTPASPTGFGTGGILHLKGSTGNDCSIVLEGLSGSGGRQEIGASGGALQFYRGAATGSMTESMRINSSGKVGIGVSASLQGQLNVGEAASGDPSMYVFGSRGAADNLPAGHLTFRNVANGVGDVNLSRIQSLTGTGSNQTQKGQLAFSTNDGSSLTERLRIDSSGNVGIGTSSPDDDLHIANNTQAGPALRLENQSVSTDSNTIYASINFEGNDNSAGANGIRGSIVGKSESSNGAMGLLFSTASAGSANTERMRITSSGELQVTGNGVIKNQESGGNFSYLQQTSSDARLYVQYSQPLLFGTNNTERMRLTSSGRVGIGCVPQGNLDIDVAVDTSLGLRSQTGVIVAQYTGAPAIGNRAQIGLGYGNTYTNVSIGAVRTSATAYGTDDFIIATKSGTADTAPTERMRLTSSGNLLVGKTANDVTTAGVNLNSNGYVSSSVPDAPAAYFNRISSDGAIANFSKDGTTVGSIGTEVTDATLQADLYVHARSTAGGSSLNESRLWLLGGDSGIVLDGYTNAILPTDENSYEDNRTNLGSDAYRFKDLYLSGGVYQSGTRLIKRTATSAGGSTIFASITNAPQTGFIHIYEIGTTNYAILACTKRDTSSDVVTTVVANNVLTVNATNAGGTVAVTGHTTTGNVRMQATIIREA